MQKKIVKKQISRMYRGRFPNFCQKLGFYATKIGFLCNVWHKRLVVPIKRAALSVDIRMHLNRTCMTRILIAWSFASFSVSPIWVASFKQKSDCLLWFNFNFLKGFCGITSYGIAGIAGIAYMFGKFIYIYIYLVVASYHWFICHFSFLSLKILVLLVIYLF